MFISFLTNLQSGYAFNLITIEAEQWFDMNSGCDIDSSCGIYYGYGVKIESGQSSCERYVDMTHWSNP
jgi:hypothetical protein